MGDGPSAPIDAAGESGVESVKDVSRNVCEGADVAAAARQGHETHRFMLQDGAVRVRAMRIFAYLAERVATSSTKRAFSRVTAADGAWPCGTSLAS